MASLLLLLPTVFQRFGCVLRWIDRRRHAGTYSCFVASGTAAPGSIESFGVVSRSTRIPCLSRGLLEFGGAFLGSCGFVRRHSALVPCRGHSVVRTKRADSVILRTSTRGGRGSSRCVRCRVVSCHSLRPSDTKPRWRQAFVTPLPSVGRLLTLGALRGLFR